MAGDRQIVFRPPLYIALAGLGDRYTDRDEVLVMWRGPKDPERWWKLTA